MTLHLIAMLSVLAVAAPVPAQQLTESQTREARDLFNSGMQALLSERYDDAERDFRGAVKIDPLYDAAFYGLGQVYMATKRYERAVKAYLDSRDAFKASTAAEALDRVGTDRRIRDQIVALKDYVRSLARTAQVNQRTNVQAAVDRYNDQIRELESRLNRAVGARPPVPAGLSMALGSAYFRLDRLSDAEREYKAAIEVNPKFGEAHNNLAVVYMMTDRLDQAEEEVKAAEKNGFTVNPRFKEDLRNKKREHSPSGLQRIDFGEDGVEVG